MVTKIIQEDIENIIANSNISSDNLNNKTFLVTGSTGMIGKYITFTLLQLASTYHLHIILMGKSREKIIATFDLTDMDRIRIIETDFLKPIELNDHVDYVFHAASLASPVYYETKPVDVIVPNTMGTYYLLNCLKNKDISKFLFFSSSEIYGIVNKENNYNESDVGISDPYDVRNCYAESKRCGENLCQSFFKQYGMPTNSVRIYHTYGPTMDIENDQRAFCEFTQRIVKNQDIIIKGDGMARRPFLYITDAIIAFFKILFDAPAGEVYNMSNEDQYVSILDLAKVLTHLYPEKKSKYIFANRNTNDSYSIKKDENYITGSSNKLNALGWQAKVTIETGFDRTIKSKTEEMKYDI